VPEPYAHLHAELRRQRSNPGPETSENREPARRVKIQLEAVEFSAAVQTALDDNTARIGTNALQTRAKFDEF